MWLTEAYIKNYMRQINFQDMDLENSKNNGPNIYIYIV